MNSQRHERKFPCNLWAPACVAGWLWLPFACPGCNSDEGRGPNKCDTQQCEFYCDPVRDWCLVTLKNDGGNCPANVECVAFKSGCDSPERCNCVPDEYQDACFDFGQQGVTVSK